MSEKEQRERKPQQETVSGKRQKLQREQNGYYKTKNTTEIKSLVHRLKSTSCKGE